MPTIRRAVSAAIAGLGPVFARPPGAAAQPVQPRIDDPRMAALLRPGAPLVQLAEGLRWCEGPAWVPGLGLVFSDVRADREWLWQPTGLSIRREPSGHSNGHTVDRQGRLIACESGNRCVSRIDADGRRSVLADRFEGKRLNSPNDAVVKSDGTIWFTDPAYGLLQPDEGYGGTAELDGCFLFRLDPADGTLSVAADTLQQPNGLAFSPDEAVLYVSDTSEGPPTNGTRREIRAFDVAEGRHLRNERRFAQPLKGVPDGFRLDRAGNLFSSSGDGVEVFAPDGTRLGGIPVPGGTVANLCFGGEEGRHLFLCAGSRLFALEVATAGALP
ncbi:SMP-30/gluconolactonase/LRE family protein [Roseomonas sp. BN140053]|uniref:SMP-30/gluconolactonase/LRE family protein n=1 Tax=Roseomonas sp. BN140053 TaxID=3391898 RepID=UPI0039ECB49C